VESHVENVMRKLGITSRTRVASALAQRRPGHSQRP
jgi:DNA-binding NarL/FixJ family response regulator